MKRRIVILPLLFLWIMVSGEDCILKVKDVEFPARGSEEIPWTIFGCDPTDMDTEIIDFAGILLDLEADNEFDALLSSHIEAGFIRVSRNDGETDLEIGGSVFATWLNPPPEETDPGPHILATYSSPIAAITSTTEWFQVPMMTPGVELLNRGFDYWLQQRALGNVPEVLEFKFDYTVSATPGPPDPCDPEDYLNFDLDGLIKFTLVGLVSVEVPDP